MNAKSTKENAIFNVMNLILLTIGTFIIFYPIWNVVVSSFSSANQLATGTISFYPKEFTLDNYAAVFRDNSIWNAFLISILKTILGVATHVFFCSMVAYGMSKNYLMGRKLYTTIGLITMFFSGGMVPTYLLYRQLHLLDNFLVYILPAMFTYFDMVILMNFFRNVPGAVEESATIDGAGTWQVFLRIILPLSKPALATIALFNGVGQWNDYMSARMYINDKALYPVQMKLFEIIVQSQTQTMLNPAASAVMPTTTRSIQLATIVVTALPIIMVYPFLQKYFVSGMTLGAVKE